MSPAMVMSPATVRFDGIHDSPEKLYQKGVKNLFDNGIDHVPKKYVLPASDRPNATTTRLTEAVDDLELPVIDFSQLLGPNRDEVIDSLAYACENYGFFQIVNHGVSEEVIKSMESASRRFFEMPLSERERYMTADMNSPVRYGTSFNQTNDGVFCWRDFLKLMCPPLPNVLSHWPSSPPDFRQLAVAYAEETKALFMMVVEAILESLGLHNTTTAVAATTTDTPRENEGDESSIILNELENGSQLMVVNCYPPCPEPELTLGMPPHSDYGFLTLLLQDDVEGLQVLHKDRWLTVRPIPGSFVVNVGDHLEIFSNGRYKSVLHRVVVNSTNNRVSVASLHSFPFTSTVRPAEGLVTEANPRRYKDTDFSSFLEYIKSRDSKEKNFLESRKLN